MKKNYNPVGIINMGKEIKIDKCYRCGSNEVYEGYVTCKSCIADTLIFNEEFAVTILGTIFFDNFKIEEWEDVINERLEYHLNSFRNTPNPS